MESTIKKLAQRRATMPSHIAEMLGGLEALLTDRFDETLLLKRIFSSVLNQEKIAWRYKIQKIGKKRQLLSRDEVPKFCTIISVQFHRLSVPLSSLICLILAK